MAETPQSTTIEYNTDYFRTPAGALRIIEAVVALGAIISAAEGSSCYSDTGRYGFFLFVVITSLLQAILVLILIIFRLEQKIKVVNVPLSLLVNDGIILIFYFLSTVLMMLSIGRCRYRMEARIIASLFAICGFLTLVGLSYTDYRWWQGEESPSSKKPNHDTPPTATETTPTVLTLS